MKSYRCSQCGYKTKKESVPERCNYCSKKGSMVELEDAEKLIDLID